jgi:hypothetical protein
MQVCFGAKRSLLLILNKADLAWHSLTIGPIVVINRLLDSACLLVSIIDHHTLTNPS